MEYIDLILLIRLIKIRAALLLYLEVGLKVWTLLNFKVKVFAAVTVLSIIILAVTSAVTSVILLGLNYRNIVSNQAFDSSRVQLIVC